MSATPAHIWPGAFASMAILASDVTRIATVGAGVSHDVRVNLGVSHERLRDAVAADGTPDPR